MRPRSAPPPDGRATPPCDGLPSRLRRTSIAPSRPSSSGSATTVDAILYALLSPRPLPARGRARPRQDAAGEHAGAAAGPALRAHPVHAGPHALRHHRHRDPGGGRQPPAGGASCSCAGRSSPACCSPTRSTARRPRPRPRCSRPCRRGRSPSRARSTTLAEPFLVLATQNPIEQEGTYPLPEAQLVRLPPSHAQASHDHRTLTAECEWRPTHGCRVPAEGVVKTIPPQHPPAPCGPKNRPFPTVVNPDAPAIRPERHVPDFVASMHAEACCCRTRQAFAALSVLCRAQYIAQ